MESLVNHILYLADNNKMKITQLQLHKVSYFAFGYILSTDFNKAKKMYEENDNFEAWMYGPVLPKTYLRFNIFKSTPILEKGELCHNLSSIKGLNDKILELLKENPYSLVKKSHKHSFWDRHKKDIFNNKRPQYTLEELIKDFDVNGE